MKYAPYLFCLFWGTTSACGSTVPGGESYDPLNSDLQQDETDSIQTDAQSEEGGDTAQPIPVIETQPSPEAEPVPISFNYNFDASAQGWVCGFADYPPGQEQFFELNSAREELPDPITPKTHAFRVSGHNHSDDLFMFLKTQVTGLKPAAKYRVHFDLTLASPEPVLSIGAGGSPATSVHLKVGATQIEPQPVVKDGYTVLNIDHGNQFNNGADMVRIGDIGIPGDEFAYALIRRTSQDAPPIEVTADTQGSAWLIIGTDSGFEGKTILYYDSIQARFEAVP